MNDLIIFDEQYAELRFEDILIRAWARCRFMHLADVLAWREKWFNLLINGVMSWD